MLSRLGRLGSGVGGVRAGKLDSAGAESGCERERGADVVEGEEGGNGGAGWRGRFCACFCCCLCWCLCCCRSPEMGPAAETMVLVLVSLPGLVVPVLGPSAVAEAAVTRAPASAPALALAAVVVVLVIAAGVPAWAVPWSLLINDKPCPSSWAWLSLWC